MTYNIFVKCDVCGSISDLKWQVGELSKNVFRICCGRCKTVIECEVTANNGGFNYKFKNAKEIEAKLDSKCDYIIPMSGEILTEKMRDGKEMFKPTPFINIVSLVGIDTFSNFSHRFLRGVERIDKWKIKCDRLNDLYINKEFNYLKQMIKKDFNINIKKSNIKNICKEKYNIDFNYYKAFTNQTSYSGFRDKVLKRYKKLKAENKNEYEQLLEFIKNDINNFEKRIRNTLNIFINNYNYFIPVLILDNINENKKKDIYSKYSITTVHFEDVRDLYLRIFENIIEVSTFFVALNNIIYRGKYDKIDDTVIKNKTTIQQYKKLTKGDKVKFITKEEFFNLIIPKFDKNIRNAIGHEDIEYDVFNQKLTYKEGETSLIEYVYNSWECYDLCLLMYEIIIDIKLQKLIADK